MTTWQLTVDANDPARLAAFWAPILGYRPQPPPDGAVSWLAWYRSVGVPEHELMGLDDDYCDRIEDPEGHGPSIWFQVVPEVKAGKNRLHLDVYPEGRDRSRPFAERRAVIEATVADLVTRGGSVVQRYPDDFDDAPADADHYFVVMGDPEGNEFCVGG